MQRVEEDDALNAHRCDLVAQTKLARGVKEEGACTPAGVANTPAPPQAAGDGKESYRQEYKGEARVRRADAPGLIAL